VSFGLVGNPARLDRGEDTLAEIPRSYAVSQMTISRIKSR
jgi:hypothetical protein